MARTRTPGIRVDRNGGLIVDKEHRGIPIYIRLGLLSQEQAEQRLIEEIDRVNALLQCNANRRPTFADCAARYLTDSKNKRSVDATAWHIRLLIPYVGTLDIRRVHDGTLQSFIATRLASGVTATTINRSLEVVRTILTRAARSYRDDDGRPWLETMPPLISMLPETPRAPTPSRGTSRIDSLQSYALRCGDVFLQDRRSARCANGDSAGSSLHYRAGLGFGAEPPSAGSPRSRRAAFRPAAGRRRFVGVNAGVARSHASPVNSQSLCLSCPCAGSGSAWYRGGVAWRCTGAAGWRNRIRVPPRPG